MIDGNYAEERKPILPEDEIIDGKITPKKLVLDGEKTIKFKSSTLHEPSFISQYQYLMTEKNASYHPTKGHIIGVRDFPYTNKALIEKSTNRVLAIRSYDSAKLEISEIRVYSVPYP